MYHFISGLPRSGSTLLASILRQCPSFHASMMSPLGYSTVALHHSFSPDNETAMFYSEEQRVHMIEAIFDAYYEKEIWQVIFDNNRRWCAYVGMLAKTFPKSKIICCVRPPAHVVDSLERLVQKNPLIISKIFACTPNQTVYERVNSLMAATGLVGYAFHAFREAFYGPHRDRLIIVNYKDLAGNPAHTMRTIHEELGIELFPYNFDKIEQIPGADEFDAIMGAPGLHALKPKVLYQPQNSILPPDIYQALPSAFWLPVKKPETSAT
jgi:sulfotransferase